MIHTRRRPPLRRLLVLLPIVLAACSSSTSSSTTGSQSQSSGAGAATSFQGCGAVAYAEPRPSFQPTAGATPRGLGTGAPVTNDEALAAVHQQIVKSGMAFGGVVSCSIGTFKGSDIASLAPSLQPVPSSVVVVLARGKLAFKPVKGTVKSPQFVAVMFVVGSAHPLQLLDIAGFSKEPLPAPIDTLR